MDLREPKPAIGELSLKRMVRVVEGVRSRLLRAAKALEDSKVAYAVAGGNAVGAWVARVHDIVNAVFSGEKVGPDHLPPVPDVTEAGQTPEFRLLNLESLVRMKLSSFRRKDQVHQLDFAEVGLIDETWLNRLPSELSERMREILSNPEGSAPGPAGQGTAAYRQCCCRKKSPDHGGCWFRHRKGHSSSEGYAIARAVAHGDLAAARSLPLIGVIAQQEEFDSEPTISNVRNETARHEHPLPVNGVY